MNTDILIEYIEGTLDSIDSDLVEEWIAYSSENRDYFKQLCELLCLNDRVAALEAFDVDKSYIKFKESIDIKPNKRVIKAMPFVRRIASVAAIAILLLSIGAFTTLAVLDNTSQTIRVATNLGERAQVDLPDGTKVWLNACSSIDYKKSILRRKRVANIEGEGYFEVAHNKTLPFIVKNNSSEIEVLGTNFNVRSNIDEDNIIVSLLEGSIAFNDKCGAYAKLSPGESVVFNKKNNTLSLQSNQYANDMTAWLKGRLVFDNYSLEEISKSLERHYNVKISFADDMVKLKRFTAEFGVSDNIYQILSILELTNSFEHEVNNREIVIKSIN